MTHPAETFRTFLCPLAYLIFIYASPYIRVRRGSLTYALKLPQGMTLSTRCQKRPTKILRRLFLLRNSTATESLYFGTSYSKVFQNLVGRAPIDRQTWGVIHAPPHNSLQSPRSGTPRGILWGELIPPKTPETCPWRACPF